MEVSENMQGLEKCNLCPLSQSKHRQNNSIPPARLYWPLVLSLLSLFSPYLLPFPGKAERRTITVTQSKSCWLTWLCGRHRRWYESGSSLRCSVHILITIGISIHRPRRQLVDYQANKTLSQKWSVRVVCNKKSSFIWNKIVGNVLSWWNLQTYGL